VLAATSDLTSRTAFAISSRRAHRPLRRAGVAQTTLLFSVIRIPIHSYEGLFVGEEVSDAFGRRKNLFLVHDAHQIICKHLDTLLQCEHLELLDSEWFAFA